MNVFIPKHFLCLVLMLCAVPPLHAEYADEIRDQIEEINQKAAGELDEMYFHDMGIVARKADEAELNVLASEIIRTHLLEKMDQYAKEKIRLINQMYGRGEYQASQELRTLSASKVYYEPTQEFLRTGLGKTLKAEAANSRQQAMTEMGLDCGEETLVHAIQAVRKTGLFTTREPDETMDLRRLIQTLECCISWKSEIHYVDQQAFATDYDAGTLTEEAHLKLESSGQDLMEAQWVGDWIYRIQAKEGKAEGVSRAQLRFKKDQDIANLVISSAKLNSIGRVNMPIPLSGDNRTLEISGSPIAPRIHFSGSQQVELNGCRANAPEAS